jgi:hypothetical protein
MSDLKVEHVVSRISFQSIQEIAASVVYNDEQVSIKFSNK